MSCLQEALFALTCRVRYNVESVMHGSPYVTFPLLIELESFFPQKNIKRVTLHKSLEACKRPFFTSDFNRNLVTLANVSESLQYRNL